MQEIWKTTERLKGFYEVSNLGRVRRVAPAIGTLPGRILKPNINPVSGYCYLQLLIGYKNRVAVSIHRLVCEAFHGAPNGKQEAHHKNHNPADNHSENLEWTTHLGNIRHNIAANTSLKGSRNPQSKLTENDIKEIRKRLADGESNKSVARAYSMHPVNVSRIKTRKIWAHVA